MNVLNKILCILCYLSVTSASSQHNANWVFPYGFRFDFSKGSLNIDTNFNNLMVNNFNKNNVFPNYAYSTKKGELLFYSNNIDTIYDSNNNVICITDSLPISTSHQNSRSYIIPEKNDTDFKLILSTTTEVNGQTEIIISLNQYNFKWINNKYVCLNEKNPIILFQNKYPINISYKPFVEFSHFAISPDSIVFISNNSEALYLFLYTNNTFQVMDSIPFGINETFKLSWYYQTISNEGGKYILFLKNNTTQNTFLLEGTINNLKFGNLKIRFKNLIFPPTNLKMDYPNAIYFNYNDSFYYLVPFEYKYISPSSYRYIYKVRFNDTITLLNHSIPYPVNFRDEFYGLSYDNKHYIFSHDPQRTVKILTLSDTVLTEIFERTYDSLLMQSSNFSPLFPQINFITEPYLLLDYRITKDCRMVNFYNESNIRFRDHKLYIEALNDTFDFKDSISIYIPKTFNKTYYKVTSVSTTGVTKWMEDTLRFDKLLAGFSTNTDTICRSQKVIFNDHSIADKVSNLGYSYYWVYGDGTMDTLKNLKNPINTIEHVYNKTGNFTPRLIFSNGICTDTFVYPNKIVVKWSITPGYELSTHKGCIPLTVTLIDTLNNNILLKEYDFGNGFVTLNSSKVLDTTIQISVPGIYIIKQRLTSTSGCISNFIDSLVVLNSISKNDTIKVFYTTVLDSFSTQTIWKSIPNATTYIINNKNIRDTFFIDNASFPNKQSVEYVIQAKDTCGNLSTASFISKTIWLKAQNQNFNEYALLEYTPFETWIEGVLNYEIEYFNRISQKWENISTLSGNVLTYKSLVLPDSSNTNISTAQICYRVKAIERNGNKQQSISNVVCIPIYPTVFLPNAFSPNGDGINDYYKPVCSGLNAYVLEIYDRWGQLVYVDTPDGKGWDGTFRGEKADIGTYVFRLSAAGYLLSPFTNDARRVERKGTLFLVR